MSTTVKLAVSQIVRHFPGLGPVFDEMGYPPTSKSKFQVSLHRAAPLGQIGGLSPKVNGGVRKVQAHCTDQGLLEAVFDSAEKAGYHSLTLNVTQTFADTAPPELRNQLTPILSTWT